MNETNNKSDEAEHSDEDSGILIEELLKIHDPETGDVHYEGRV